MRIGEMRELAPHLVNGSIPDVLLADVSLEDTADLEALGNFARAHGASTAVIATSASATLDGMRRLMRVGIHDFVPQPIVEADLMNALETALQRRQQAAPIPTRTGRIVTFLRSCGGIGATTIATQTALALAHSAARRQQRVALLDLDFQNGGCALALDLNPAVSIEGILDAPERLDATFLDGSMIRHPSGLEVLAASKHRVPFDAMTSELAGAILRFAALERSYV
ncbi:MAG: AAA family ATPase, partial [Pseudomonadota bacterium]